MFDDGEAYGDAPCQIGSTDTAPLARDRLMGLRWDNGKRFETVNFLVPISPLRKVLWCGWCDYTLPLVLLAGI